MVERKLSVQRISGLIRKRTLSAGCGSFPRAAVLSLALTLGPIGELSALERNAGVLPAS